MRRAPLLSGAYRASYHCQITSNGVCVVINQYSLTHVIAFLHDIYVGACLWVSLKKKIFPICLLSALRQNVFTTHYFCVHIPAPAKGYKKTEKRNVALGAPRADMKRNNFIGARRHSYRGIFSFGMFELRFVPVGYSVI
jgi:hypothetical protein